MSYKESLAYSKDFIKGTKLEVLKKKLIMPYTGTATIKLFDSLTGKQTYEAKSENRISAVFGNIAYLDGFYSPILDNTQNNLLYNIYSTYPFRVMTLTTGDIPEDAYDYFTWGNVIGYADGVDSYSGSDNLRGSVNQSETTRTYAKKHYVIDFPTNAANGTFRSIYWAGAVMGSSGIKAPKLNYTYIKKSLEKGASGSNLSNYNLCTDESNLYVLKVDTTVLYVYDKITCEKKSNINLSVAAKAIAYGGANFWILISDGSFKKLDKSFGVVASYAKSATIPGDLISNVHYYDIEVNEATVFIAYNGCTDSLGTLTKYKSCIARYNKDGTFANRGDIYLGNWCDITLTKITNNKLLVIIYSGAWLQLNFDLTPYGAMNFNTIYYKSVTWDKDTSTIFTADYSSYGELKQEYIIPASAHTLLPEAITKTPTNTMKIQYDFTCDYVYPLDMPSH